MAKQTIEVEVPDGWEVVSVDPIEDAFSPGVNEATVVPCVELRRVVHVWPEAVLQFARHLSLKWMVVDQDGYTMLASSEPSEADNYWRSAAVVNVPRSWAPPHDYTGEGWRRCKWRLPV